jgi:integrase
MLAGHLAPLRKAEGLLVSRPDGQPFASGFCRRAIAGANAACSVKGITPHRLRGTIATLLSEDKVPVQDIKAYLRHKDVRTTMAYLERNMDRVTQAQGSITEKAARPWRESGEENESKPYAV